MCDQRQIGAKRLVLVTGILLAMASSRQASAHEGPPFPILMDKHAAGHVVEVWADPDIGEARFFIIIESPSGGPPHESPVVSMWVEPVSGRLDRTTCEAEQQTLRNRVQFAATPYFDQQDWWRVGFRITNPGGETEELTTEIESTPPGFGLWDFAIYLFPFLLLGGMWVLAMVRRSRMRFSQPSSAACAEALEADRELVETKMENRT